MNYTLEEILNLTKNCPEGAYISDDGHLFPVHEKEDDIPFCDMNCEEFVDYDEIEDVEFDEDTFWGIPDIRRIVFNPPATIVFWEDDTKTVVKCMEGERFERYAGFAAACMKKMFGSTSRAKAIMDESDQELISAAVAEEKEQSKAKISDPNSKKSCVKAKEIPMDALVSICADACMAALFDVIRDMNHKKENKDETPAE